MFALLLGACGNHPGGRGAAGSEDNGTKDTVIATDLTTVAAHFADSVLNTLTLEERVGQCFMPSVYSSADPYTLEYLQKLIDDGHIGGIVLMQGDTASARKISEVSAQAKIPLFVSIDAEWGLGMRLRDAQTFPRNGIIRKDAEDTYLYDYGREVGRECKQSGINMVLGPVVDVSPVNRGVIGSRAFGDDVNQVSDMGVAYAKGLESAGIISMAKHFPGHGGSVTDSHIGAAVINKGISTLDSIDFMPFKQYINSGLTGIMAGHINVPAINPGGEPATVSYDILTTLLRDEMGFKGLVLTDAFSMGGVKGFSAYQALEAGADIVLCPERIHKEMGIVVEKVRNGEMSEEIINDRCRRILFYKAIFGLWNRGKSRFGIDDTPEEVTQEIIKNLS